MGDSIDIILRVSPRAHTISLRPKFDKNQIILTMPHARFEKKALAFYDSKKDWIQKQLARHKPIPKIQFCAQETALICGQSYLLQPSEKSGVFIDGNTLFVSGNPAFFDSRVRRFSFKLFEKHATERLAFFCSILGKKQTELHIKKMTSRWGSCSNYGIISLAQQLAFAPDFVIDYVIAHEVAHLVEMNHSPAFWKLVSGVLNQDASRAKAWLKVHGGSLC